MIKNYLKIAFRNLLRNRTYSFINIVGLAMGISVSVLILMFVMHEFSYDKFHKDHERIFRVAATWKTGEESRPMYYFNAKFGPTLKQYNPEVVNQVRVTRPFNQVVIKSPEHPTELFYEKDFLYADPSFFSVFSFPLKSGSVLELSKPFTMVISGRAAQKYFGNHDPLGKSLVYEGKHLMQIVGVAENAPSNSSLTFDFVASMATYPQLSEMNKNNWEASNVFNTYVLLDSDRSADRVTKNMKREADRTEAYVKFENYGLENISAVHLGNNLTDTSNNGLVNIFIGVAGLILCLALFNYMSLTTARATLRAKEVGVRKAIGAARSGLVRQFYIESFLLCSVAFGLAYVLITLLQAPFYTLLDIRIDSSFLLSASFIGWVIGLLIFTSLIAGGYPALILSGFAPLEVLKGRVVSAQGSVGVRRFFMVLQFTVSITLIISSFIVRAQLSHMQNKDLGVYKDQVLSIPLTVSGGKGLMPLRDEIRELSGVKDVTVASSGLFKYYISQTEKNQKTKKDVSLYTIKVDRNFVKTMGLRYKTRPDSGTYLNRNHYLLNEVAVKELGLKQDLVGEKIEYIDVAGVVKDFNFQSLQSNVEPLGLHVVGDSANLNPREGASRLLYARLDPKSNMEEKVAAIGQIFKKYNKERPFEYYFLNDAFNETFKTEIRLSHMFTIFTGFAIFIACMGLFGLAAFTAETRIKEIGIRKVLGASVAGIVVLLSRDFVKLVLLSIVIASPIAWYGLNKWLQSFLYRISIEWWVFALTGLLVIGITLITVSFQSIKAALMNPVTTLKGE